MGRFRFHRATHVLSALSLMFLVLGCASGNTHEAHNHGMAVSSRPGPPATLEQLASQMDCKPQSRNAEYQQEQCETSASHYVVTTFATDKGEQDWLAAAMPYGGAYLVGTRWVVVANEPQALEELRHRFGGEVQAGSAHHH